MHSQRPLTSGSPGGLPPGPKEHPGSIAFQGMIRAN
jgi:hypothetical protein